MFSSRGTRDNLGEIEYNDSSTRDAFSSGGSFASVVGRDANLDSRFTHIRTIARHMGLSSPLGENLMY